MLALVPDPAANRPRYVPIAKAAPEFSSGWPLLSRPIPTGAPALADDHVEDYLSLDAHLIRNPDGSFLVRVQGNALHEAGLHDGDLLIVDRTIPPLTGSVVVAAKNGQFALRRLYRADDGRLLLEPLAPAPTASLDSATEDFEIWGVVRWVVHRLWPSRERQVGAEPGSFQS
jgi:DNA polymerase V